VGPTPPVTVGPADRHRNHPPAGPHAWLTSPDRPHAQKGNHRGTWNPARPARQPGRQTNKKPRNNRDPKPNPTQPRSRKTSHELKCQAAIFSEWCDQAVVSS
jgi:hypothetical protein